MRTDLTESRVKRAGEEQHVGGDDHPEGAEMGEAAGEEHVLLRRPGDDGPPEGGLLPDPVPHRRDLLPVLRLRVSPDPIPTRFCSQKELKGRVSASGREPAPKHARPAAGNNHNHNNLQAGSDALYNIRIIDDLI